MKYTPTEMKNTLQGINSTVDETQNKIRDLEYKEAKNTQSEQQEEKRIWRASRWRRGRWSYTHSHWIPVLSHHPIRQQPSFLGGTILSLQYKPGKEQGPHPLEFFSPHHVLLSPVRSQWHKLEHRSLGWLRRCQWLVLGWGHFPNFPIKLNGASPSWKIK